MWEALKSIGSLKAPGPDGFQPIFFKTYWEVVGDDVTSMVRTAFESGDFPSFMTGQAVPSRKRGLISASTGMTWTDELGKGSTFVDQATD